MNEAILICTFTMFTIFHHYNTTKLDGAWSLLISPIPALLAC